jgi:toxin HigB-1
MILLYAGKEPEKIWRGERSRRLPSTIQDAALCKLRILHAAKLLGDLNVPPGNRLEALTGDRKGQWSIRINDQWRICFRWSANQGGPSDVEIVDYH